MSSTNGVSGLVKVEKGKVEIACSVYSRLGAKAENELFEKVQVDIEESGITHVGKWWWKKEINDELHLISLARRGLEGVGAKSGKSVIFEKYKSEMKFASIYYYVACGRLREKGAQVYVDMKHLVKAADYDHIYLSPKAAKWLTDMLEVEEYI